MSFGPTPADFHDRTGTPIDQRGQGGASIPAMLERILAMNATIELDPAASAQAAPAPAIAALPPVASPADLDAVHEQALIRLGRAGRAGGA
jgi:hypothetical protein